MGTEVLARDDESFEDEYQKVEQLFSRTADYYYTLSTGFDEIKTTAEHPFWVQGKGWTKAADLRAGHAVATAKGDILIRTSTRVDEPITVYNFEVANDHSYFVSNNRLRVHNPNEVCDLATQRTRQAERAADIARIVDEDYLNWSRQHPNGNFEQYFRSSHTRLPEGVPFEYGRDRGWRNPEAPDEWLYPPNDGFLTRTNGSLHVGQTVDRYITNGRNPLEDRGRFLSEDGITEAQRALPEGGTEGRTLIRYRVIREINVEQGPAAPWFGQNGGGTQYFTGDRSLADLLDPAQPGGAFLEIIE